MRSDRRSARTALIVACVALLLPAVAAADDDRDVRRAGSCTGAAETTLRLRADDGVIRISFEVESVRAGSRWSLIVLHERRIVYRVTVRAGSGRSLELRRTVRDWVGPDTVVVRASGPEGASCRVLATL